MSAAPTASAATAQAALAAASSAVNTSTERLATGSQINRGADDPSGLIAAEALDAELAVLEAEAGNIERTNAVAATADGALAEVSTLLNRAAGLAVSNANTGALSDAEIEANNIELASISTAIGLTLSNAGFGGRSLFDGTVTLAAGGAELSLERLSLSGLGLSETGGSADAIAAAAEQIATLRGSIGAFQANTLAPLASGLGAEIESTAAALSVIRDTDFASQTAELARAQTLRDASTLLLTGANDDVARFASLIFGG